MPIFEYSAVDNQGKTIRGSLSGQSLTFAQQELIRRGLRVIQLNPVAEQGLQNESVSSETRPSVNPNSHSQQQFVQNDDLDPDIHSAGIIPPPQIESRQTVPLNLLADFFTQLGSMLHAGVLPFETFESLGRQFPQENMRAICNEMAQSSYKGESFVDVMALHRGVFSPLMMALMRAGEKGGDIPFACRENARYIKDEIEIRRKVRLATLLPKLQLGGGLLIIGIANFFGRMLAGRNIFKSPLHEPIVFIPLLIICVAIFVFLRYGVRNPRVRLGYEKFLLSVPVFGKTISQFAVAKFGKALGALYRAGMSPSESVQLAADACGNAYIRARLYQAVPRLDQGHKLADCFEELKLFNPTVMTMIRTGEKSGEVSEMLEHMSTHYEEEAKGRAHSTAIIGTFIIALIIIAYLASMVFSGWMGMGDQYKDMIDKTDSGIIRIMFTLGNWNN